MRDHLKSRIPELKLHRVNDTCCVDTFFSSVVSVRGFTNFNLYCYKSSGLDIIYLQTKRSQSTETVKNCFLVAGIPHTMHSDNAPEFKGKKWCKLMRRYIVKKSYTEPYHPNQNLAERRGGVIKSWTTHLLTITGAPLDYWCFCIEYVVVLNSILARKSLGWRTAHELHWGDTPDISMFRFCFWQPVWYYNPNVAFPSPKMLKGRFLGFAQNVADSFCYLILTNTIKEGDKPSILARSVVRPRYRDEDPPVYTNTDEKKLIIFKNDKVTPLEDPEPEIIKMIIDFSAKYTAIEEEGPVKRKRDDGFDDNIDEVLGPPTKRSKLYSKSQYLPSPQAITQI